MIRILPGECALWDGTFFAYLEKEEDQAAGAAEPRPLVPHPARLIIMVADRRVGDRVLEVVQQTLPPYPQTFTIQLQILELDIVLEVVVVQETTAVAAIAFRWLYAETGLINGWLSALTRDGWPPRGAECVIRFLRWKRRPERSQPLMRQRAHPSPA